MRGEWGREEEWQLQGVAAIALMNPELLENPWQIWDSWTVILHNLCFHVLNISNRLYVGDAASAAAKEYTHPPQHFTAELQQG